MAAKKKPAMTPAEQIVHDACREVISAIRLGRRVGRTVPTALLAKSLAMAADEADALDAA